LNCDIISRSCRVNA